MSEIVPTLAESHVFRTYPGYYAESDTESEEEVNLEMDSIWMSRKLWILEPDQNN